MFLRKRSPKESRALMVKKQLADRSIFDQRVLEAMERVPRHRFVSKELKGAAYKDRPLPIGYGQTISQPYIVAFMTQVLQLPTDGEGVVLEIGTGSGYQAAILSRLVAKVYSIERIGALAEKARQTLDELGIDNVEIKVGDGGNGWPEHAPYDAIITTAAAPEVPPPLVNQLKEDGGRLLAPIGPKYQQELICIERQGDQFEEERLVPVAFVPLIGEHGWGARDLG